MRLSPYIGRFAPSPSGPLHLGSLVTALASYLDARKHQGKWLIRIEDSDIDRCKDEHAIDIIDTLESYNLISDEKIITQSHRHHLYQKQLDHLTSHGLTFPCNCTRQQLHQQLHKTICQSSIEKPHSWRLKLPDQQVSFVDQIQGPQTYTLLSEIGHPIIKRKDSNFSYLLAVVVDDHLQNITHVVRGMDLIDTSAAQIHLFSTLGWTPPQYSHIPIVRDKQHRKLSKQNHAPAIPKSDKTTLQIALRHLHIEVSMKNSIPDILESAVEKWCLIYPEK